MPSPIPGLFASFNPLIVGLLLSAGASIALHHRMAPAPRAFVARAYRNAPSSRDANAPRMYS